MKHLLHITISLFFLVGCNVPQSFPPEYFANSKSITAKRIIDLEKFGILKPMQVESYKDWYVFDDGYHERGCVKFLSKECDKSFGCLRIGNGPFELTQAYSINSIGDSIYVFDVNHHRIINLDYQDSLRLSYLSSDCNLSLLSKPVDFDRFVNISNFKDSAFLTLEDAAGKILSGIDFPYDENLSCQPLIIKRQMFINTKVLISPSKDKFAWGVKYFPSYGFGRIENDSLIIENEFEYYSCKFNCLDGGDVITDGSACVNVASGFPLEKYAVFLYNGSQYAEIDPFGQILLFYTWQGEPYLKVTLDKKLLDVKYDNQRNIVYGIAHSPEPVLVEYDMTGIID